MQMESSFIHLKQVPDQLLEERIELVKHLAEADTEAYDIVKDKHTGEHYLHYHYIQLNLSGDGEKETYNHLLPIDHDEVLTLLFENPDYSYPDQWNRAYLRNGPNGFYVWFDPAYTTDYEQSVELGNEIKARISKFKQEGSFDLESTEKFMNELDQLRKDKE
jgi:hypothetical protein